LTSNVIAKAGAAHNKGTLAFGTYNLNMTTAGNFVRAADVSAVYTSSGGELVLNLAGLTLTLNGGTIPYVQMDANITLGSDLTVSSVFEHNAGVITNGGFNMTITGTFTSAGLAAGDLFAGAGWLVAGGTTFNGEESGKVYGFENFEVNSTGTCVFATSDVVAPTACTFTIGDFKQTLGNVSTGINNVEVNTTFVRVAGSWSQTDGYLVMDNAAGTFTPAGLAVDNLEVQATLTPSADTQTYAVNKLLKLTAGNVGTGVAAHDGKLTIGNGATITLIAGVLLNDVTFGGTVNVVYSPGGALDSGFELPTETDKLTNLSLTTNFAISLTDDIQVNGKLTLSGPMNPKTAAPNEEIITMADGSTVEMKASAVLGKALNPLGGIHLIYNGVAATSAKELVGTILSTTVKANLNLSAATTVTGP